MISRVGDEAARRVDLQDQHIGASRFRLLTASATCFAVAGPMAPAITVSMASGGAFAVSAGVSSGRLLSRAGRAEQRGA